VLPDEHRRRDELELLRHLLPDALLLPVTITDEEIAKITSDLVGTLYSRGREEEKKRPLEPVLDAAVFLTAVLDRRMRSPKARVALEKARNHLRRAVEFEEELRATPSITERIREAREESAAEASGGDLAGVGLGPGSVEDES
jgi:hypothetical protein